MLHRRITVSTDKAVATPDDLPTHFFPEEFPEQPEDLREALEASDPIFRSIVVDALPILHQSPDVDRVHVYQRANFPEGVASSWPVDLLFVESRSGVGHMMEHGRGDHNWASQIDDADMIVLAHVCEAIHQSLPVVPWENFVERASRQENSEMVIDWIADTREKLWLRFSHGAGDRLFWGITSTDRYQVDSVGFMPLHAIELKEDIEDRIKILGMMDDLVLKSRG